MDHVVTVSDVVKVVFVLGGVGLVLAVVIGLLVLMAKGWDH